MTYGTYRIAEYAGRGERWCEIVATPRDPFEPVPTFPGPGHLPAAIAAAMDDGAARVYLLLIAPEGVAAA